MSTSLSTAAIASFDADVKHAYQDMGKLRDTTRVKTGVVGSTHRFPKLAAGLATRRVKQTDVVPMNLAHTNATATLEDWNAAEYTDVFDDAKTNISEREELAGSIAKAISRREDQLIIDALEATATTLTVASSIGGGNTNLNVDKLRRASRLLGDNGVGEDEGFALVGGVRWKPDANITLTVFGGVQIESQLTLYDRDGVELMQEDSDPQPVIGLAGSIRF